MTRIYYVQCNMTHAGHFAIDVPVGLHWLLLVAKTPALFWVDGQLKEYPAHSAILYRPQQKVYYQSCGSQFINDWIRFETDEPFITESTLPCGVPFAVSDADYCQKLFELLAMEHNYNRDYKDSSIDCLLRALFNKLLESCYHDKITPRYYHLLKLRAAIYNDPGHSWTVSKMAEYVRVSPGYLLSIYKKAFGVSCMDDVIDSRIRMAKECLIHRPESVADISSRCGYQNVEHFCRQFKKITGQSPRNYQKQYQFDKIQSGRPPTNSHSV